MIPAMINERLHAQLLSGEPARSVVDVVRRILAVQAQDFRGALLAIRARSRGLAASDVVAELTEQRTLVLTTLNRGTLHLARVEDYWWLQALTAPASLTGNARRLGQEGVSLAEAEKAVRAIQRALERDGPLSRSALREQVAAARVRTEGQALAHILLLAALRGLIVRGPVVDGEQAYVLVQDWLGHPPPVDRESALAELARRYLAGHGPADERDLAKWSGLGLRDCRRALRGIAEEVRLRDDGLLELADREPAPVRHPPRLLGAFDPLLHGWVSRSEILGRHSGIVTVNGLFRPFALVRGRAVATWSLPRGRVELAPLDEIAASDRAALDRDARAVEEYLA
jgi:hypothetical protein